MNPLQSDRGGEGQNGSEMWNTKEQEYIICINIYFLGLLIVFENDITSILISYLLHFWQFNYFSVNCILSA